MSHDSGLAGQASTDPKEILVVDDVPDNLRLLLQVLSSEGYRVRCVRSATMALMQVQQVRPDLVLLDILMPQMDGYEFCQRLKANVETRDIPVIFLSVLDAPENKVRAFQLGGVDYIAKPFQIEEVLARIRYQFQAHQNQHRLWLENARLRRENADQRHSLTQIDHSYQSLRQVFNCLADGIAAFRAIRNQQGEIEDFQWLMGNTAVADWLGRSPTELAGITLSELLLDHPNGDVFDLFIRVVEQHEVLQYELLCEPDGRIPLWFELMASRLGDGLVARLKNITEYKQVVTRLQAMVSDLQVLTTQDGLTQVANRRTFDQYFQMEWQRLARMQEPLSLIMADIDQFKRFNDLCGHVVGDQCLRSVARALAEVVKRPADMVARYGGEEFAILLPHTHLQGALQVANQIQARVKALRLAVPRRECEQVRLSLGVASQIPNPQGHVETLLTYADRALYQAKRQGGNQICIGIVDSEAEVSSQPRYEEALAEEEE